MTAPQPEEWLHASARQLQLGDREVLVMLRDIYQNVNETLKAMERADSSALGDLVRRAQFEQTRRVLLGQQADVFERLGDIASAAQLRAAQKAASLSARADAALLSVAGAASIGKRLYEAALETSARAVEAALARMGYSTIPLSERIYNVRLWMDGRLNRLINSALGSGLNAREFARKARDWFQPNTPGGVRYAAMRLARTEINNAFHAVSVNRAVETPWTVRMKWNLSGSHVVPDECNRLAETDEGLYAPEDIPQKPHPQCMCYVTPDNIDEDIFVENFLSGEYDEFLDTELAKEDARLGITEPAPSRQQNIATVTPIKKASNANLPKTQAAALAKFSSGMSRDDWSAAGANINAIDALIKKGLVVLTGQTKTHTAQGESYQSPTYRLASEQAAAVSFAERVAAAAKEQDALDAALFGLERRPRPEAFTADMALGVKRYTSVHYDKINNYLRGQKPKIADSARLPGWIQSIDDAMEISTLRQECLVYRGISDGSKLFGDRLQADLTGMEWIEEAYVSTSALERRTRAFMIDPTDRVLLRILVPAGTSAIEASSYDMEAEVLLRRGLKLRVVKDNGVDPKGIRMLDVEVLQP